MCSNIYDDVTDSENCGFLKNKNPKTFRVKHSFSPVKKIYINGYGVAKDFVTAEVTFKVEKHIKYA